MKSNVAHDKKNKKKEHDKERDIDGTNPPKKSTRSKKGSGSEVNSSEPNEKAARKSPGTASRKRTKRKRAPRVLMWTKFALATAVVLMLAFVALFDVSRVTSNAMMPALSRGDLVLSWAPILVSQEFQDGDIILVKPLRDSEPNYLRLIANHDEAIDYHDDKISVNGKQLSRLRLTSDAIVRPPEEPEIWRETLPSGARYRIMLPQQAIVGALNGSVCADHGAFLAGDNRMASYDSRQNGLYDDTRLRGQALVVLESVRNDGILGSWLKWVD
ncbi:MAG: signal peptidase I [Proteobacteria bacterium]|nr:signal peptidase I [Pseudomonadota bacterium]